MIDTVKLDVIYYTIGTDFEMEFNLCGCCRMRLLTDTVSTRNDFSKCLARGVSRSNIVIACGPIFGEKGLISTVAKITNIGTEIIDNDKYGIEDGSEISILKGSTPLVTSEKIFCGCIIENESQVIIILTESKSLRKKVMKELVHPYISQWSYVTSNKGSSESEKKRPADKKTEDEKTDRISDAAEKTEAEEEENKPAEKIIMEQTNKPVNNDETTTNENGDFNFNDDNADLSEPADATVTDDLYSIFSSSTPSGETANNRYYFEDYDEVYEEKPKNGFIIFLLIFVIFIALLLVFFAVIRPLIYGYEVLDYLKQVFTPRSIVNIFKFF